MEGAFSLTPNFQTARYIGIDLGSQEVGFALIQKERNGYTLLVCEALHLSRRGLSTRLATIHAWLKDRIESYWPVSTVAIEAPFVGKNVRSALTLGVMQGILWGIILERGENILMLLSPAEIKRAITGRGHATKEQVAEMLKYQLHTALPFPESEHATDAAAIALTAAYYQNSAMTRRLSKRADR